MTTKRSAIAGLLSFLSVSISFCVILDKTLSQENGLGSKGRDENASEKSNAVGTSLSVELLKLNRQVANHSECSKTKPIFASEVVDAINRMSKPIELSDQEFTAIKRVAQDQVIPGNMQLRQFVRYHTGRTMQHGRWVRLVMQRPREGAYSFEIRNEIIFERPLTQRERWAHDQVKESGSVSLIGRFVSWFPENAAFGEAVKQSIDYTPLANEVSTAFETKKAENIMKLVHRDGVSREDLAKARRELEVLIENGITKIEIEPRLYSGPLRQVQGLLSFDSNLPVESYLKLTLKNNRAVGEKEPPDTLWLELGNAAGEPKLVCYLVSEDRSKELIGKPLSGPLSTRGGFNVKRSENWIESGFEIEAPEEFNHLRQANLELWKWPLPVHE